MSIPNTNRKGRITIGLIPENSANEFENRMREGIIEAAREHNVNLICFTQLENISKDSVSSGKNAERYRHVHKILRQLVDEFEIDGLLFLGGLSYLREITSTISNNTSHIFLY